MCFKMGGLPGDIKKKSREVEGSSRGGANKNTGRGAIRCVC